MTTETIQLLGYEHKVGATSKKPYCQFNTSIGKINVFDNKGQPSLIQTLIPPADIKAFVSVEIARNDEYTNIRAFNEVVDVAQGTPENIAVEKPMEAGKELVRHTIYPSEGRKSVKTNGTMWASYAKDLIIAGKTTEEAIDIVDRLKVQFE